VLDSAHNWAAMEERLPGVAMQRAWEDTVGGRELSDLLGGVSDALGIVPPAYAQSVFGSPRSWAPWRRFSEFGLLLPWRPLVAGRYLADVLMISVPLTAPAWLPAALTWPFWHPTVIDQRPDHEGSFASHPRERWFFINGIMTNAAVAQLNAAYLAFLFHRPITLIQNSTGGVVEDLVECALDKAFGQPGEAAAKAVPAIYDALKDPGKDRVVLVAHSQGTIIASVVLRFFSQLYSPTDQLPAMLSVEPDPALAEDMPLDPRDFDPLSDDEIAKLELYCFANCATRMPYLNRDFLGRPRPWIESFGNEHDVVARLGMLAPRPSERSVVIDGPRYARPDAWGHLLNEHYLRGIEDAQRPGRKRGPQVESADPFILLDADNQAGAGVPRLYRYLNGGAPRD
jgi:hypothetical protein